MNLIPNPAIARFPPKRGFKSLNRQHLKLSFCNNVRYYYLKVVQTDWQTLRIELVFLPPYAPNLNLIERF